MRKGEFVTHSLKELYYQGTTLKGKQIDIISLFHIANLIHQRGFEYESEGEKKSTLLQDMSQTDARVFLKKFIKKEFRKKTKNRTER